MVPCLLRFVRWWFRLPIHVVRADGAYWGLALVRFIRFTLGAIPIIPFNRKKQPLAQVRHLASLVAEERLQQPGDQPGVGGGAESQR